MTKKFPIIGLAETPLNIPKQSYSKQKMPDTTRYFCVVSGTIYYIENE